MIPVSASYLDELDGWLRCMTNDRYEATFGNAYVYRAKFHCLSAMTNGSIAWQQHSHLTARIVPLRVHLSNHTGQGFLWSLPLVSFQTKSFGEQLKLFPPCSSNHM